MGTRLGRYDVIRTLAKGVLTDLLLGRASGMEGFQRHVVIKRLREEHASDPSCMEAFVNEARLAAALHHHNIVQVLDLGDGAGDPFFAMEYVHGVDLRTLLTHLAKRNEQLPLPHVVSIIASAAAALHHAHDQRGSDGKPLGIVHRQVTPGNILVGFDGNVKLVDFGIAKAAIKRSETGVGVLKGSAPYMAPEQATGQVVDRRSDVFALGIVLYELATVRRLFKGANEFLTMSAIVKAEIPRPSQYRRDVPQPLEIIVMKALARDPSTRYQSAGEMADALDKVARIIGVGASTNQLASYMKLQFGERKEPWLVEADPEVTEVDFDGGASGLAPPPAEAVTSLSLPETVDVARSSPIERARSAATPGAAPSVRPPAKPSETQLASGAPQAPATSAAAPKASSAPVATQAALAAPAAHAEPAAPPAPGTPTSLAAPAASAASAPPAAVGLRALKPTLPPPSPSPFGTTRPTAAPSIAASTPTTAVEAPTAGSAVVEAVERISAPSLPAPRHGDMTAVVEPLSLIAARAQTQRSARRRGTLVAVLAVLALGGIAGAVALWPSDDATTTTASVTTEEKPAAPRGSTNDPNSESRSALDMTARDYEAARAPADAGERAAENVDGGVAGSGSSASADHQPTKDEPPAAPTPEAEARTETEAEAEGRTETEAEAKAKTETKVEAKITSAARTETSSDNVPAVRPAPKTAKRTPPKPKPKRATTKKTTTKTKPKWNPDDLFLGD